MEVYENEVYKEDTKFCAGLPPKVGGKGAPQITIKKRNSVQAMKTV